MPGEAEAASVEGEDAGDGGGGGMELFEEGNFVWSTMGRAVDEGLAGDRAIGAA